MSFSHVPMVRIALLSCSLVGLLVGGNVGSSSGDPGNSTLRWDRKLDSTNGSTVAGFEGCNSDRFKCTFGGAAAVDMETGLVWERLPDLAPERQGWSGAINHCANREVGGRKGWHLPTVEQLASLVDRTGSEVDLNGFPLSLPNGHPFSTAWSGGYRVSTPDVTDPTKAWGVRMADGWVGIYDKTYNNSHVWCARGGQTYDGPGF